MRYKQRFITKVITPTITFYLLCFKLMAQEPLEEETIIREFSFFPEARISIAPSFSKYNENYISQSRYISIDALRYGPFVCSFSTYEIFDYGTEEKKHQLKSIYYNMEYLNISTDTLYGKFSFFIDHRCMNYVDLHAPPPRLRWYGYGAGWQSRGMLIGDKNAGHGLHFLTADDYINFSAAVRKPLYTEYYSYDYIADFIVRYDYYLTPEIIPYITGKSELFISDKTKWNRAAEFGLRFADGRTDIIPYAEYAYITDRDISVTKKRSTISAGVKIEAALSEDRTESVQTYTPGSSFLLSPELHLQGSYSKYIDDTKKNYRSDILTALNLFQIKKLSLFWNSSLVHASPRENSGLYPRYIDYYNEAGLSIKLKKIFLLEPLYRYSGFGEGNTVNAGGYNYHTGGIRLRTTGLKPGYVNSRVCHHLTGAFTLLLNTEVEFFAGWIPDNTTEDKSWIFEGIMREDIFNCKSSVTYISLAGKIERGVIPESNKSYKEIKAESGIRINSNLVFILFYQYIHRDSGNREYDLNREYHLAGVKIDI